jgi:hypothetical protein
MWLLSDHNVHNNSNNSANNSSTTIEAIVQGDNLPTEATATDLPKTKVQTLPETVNSASTAKFSITLKCRKRINDKKPCVNGKGQLYWPKINTQNAQSMNNDSNNEVDSVFQSRASRLPSIDFEFVYCVHRNMQ